jgi:hypothetical protein
MMANYTDRPEDYIHQRRPGDPPVEVTPTEARQGSWGRPVLIVLVCGLILAFIAWAAAGFYGTAIAPPSESIDNTSTSSTTADPAADPAVRDSGMIDDNVPAGTPVEKAPAQGDSTGQ